jgi:hypothetical protein
MSHGSRIGLVVVVLAAGMLAVPSVSIPNAGAAGTSSTCTGRTVLTCPEKDAFFNDDLSNAESFALDSTLFELSLPLHLNNPAIAQFWRSNVAVDGTVSLDDALMINQIADPDFEQVATLAKLTPPVIHPHGAINRQTARAMTELIDAEQTEALNLEAMLTSLDRATAASLVESRSDWLGYQEQKAAGFGRTVASAIHRLIPAQRAVAADLTRAGLHFGIGTIDLALTRAKIKRHGLTATIVSGLRRLGVPSAGISDCAHEIVGTTSIESYSLTTLLDEGSALSSERALAAALSNFAAHAPHGVPLPS